MEMKIHREQIDKLVNDDSRDQLAFAPCLERKQRKLLHNYAHTVGLKSRSSGIGKKFLDHIVHIILCEVRGDWTKIMV